jgi:uncharacterized protein YukE
MTDTLTVDPKALQNLADEIFSCHTALEGYSADMDAFLGKLRAIWAGTGSEGWQKTQKDWDDVGQAIFGKHGVLYNLYWAVEDALHHYTVAEQTITQIWT